MKSLILIIKFSDEIKRNLKLAQTNGIFKINFVQSSQVITGQETALSTDRASEWLYLKPVIRPALSAFG